MEFDAQPTLASKLLQLRPLQAEDFAALFAVAADPLLWEQHPRNDRFQEEVFRAFFDDAMKCGGALLAIDAKTDAVIGSSRYHGYNAAELEVEIGWTFLARSHWGGKYNGEMKRLMLEHAFQFVDSVIFLVGPENIRSCRAMEKISGVRDGMRTDATGLEAIAYRIEAAEYVL